MREWLAVAVVLATLFATAIPTAIFFVIVTPFDRIPGGRVTAQLLYVFDYPTAILNRVLPWQYQTPFTHFGHGSCFPRPLHDEFFRYFRVGFAAYMLLFAACGTFLQSVGNPSRDEGVPLT